MKKYKTITDYLLKVADGFKITMNGKQFREIISQEHKRWEAKHKEKCFCQCHDISGG